MLANDITVQWYWIPIQFFLQVVFIHISCLSERSTPLAKFIAMSSHCCPLLEVLANHDEIFSDPALWTMRSWKLVLWPTLGNCKRQPTSTIMTVRESRPFLNTGSPVAGGNL